jgi:putative NIF3 family GTP cyclohydrolase 1 type 2
VERHQHEVRLEDDLPVRGASERGERSIICHMAISRRQFAQVTGVSVAAAAGLTAQSRRLTAQQVVEQIQKGLGVPWVAETLDGFKSGEPSTEVSGVATTAMATMEVLSRAVREKTNLILTLEPVFFGRTDGQSPGGASPGGGRGMAGVSAEDPVFVAKKEFLQKNGLVVFRFSDNWRNRKPDPFATGLAQAMGWTKYQAGGDPLRYEIPATTIGALADGLATRLKARAGIRVVGDPKGSVRRIAMLPGVSPLAATLKALPECDVVVAGETREWESVEYAQDAVAAGQKKGLIMLGRVLSEEPGMNVCADWLKRLMPEMPVRWLPAGDPYWRPA